MHLVTYKSIDDIAPHVLETLDCSLIHIAHWRAIERMKRVDLVPKYYVLFNSESTVEWLFYCQSVQLGRQHLQSISKWNVVNSLFFTFLGLLKFKIFVIGNLLAENGKGIFYTKQNKVPSKTMLLEAVEKISQENTHSLLILKDFEAVDMQAQGYLIRDNDISMSVPLRPTWLTFDDYEKDHIHKYAQRIRKFRKATEKLVVKTLTLDEIIQNRKAIDLLYQNVVKLQSVKLAIVDDSYFVNLKTLLGDTFEITAWFYDDNLVGFQSYFIEPTSTETHLIGLQYNAPKELFIYFNILYYSIEKGIKSRNSVIQFGRTALEAKAQMGCVPHYHKTFYSVKNPILRRLVHYVADRFTDGLGSKWQQRHPLKPEKNS